jgi:hypothetical protein
MKASDLDERDCRSRGVWLVLKKGVDQCWRGTRREEGKKRRRSWKCRSFVFGQT